jgi:hypothetical protein
LSQGILGVKKGCFEAVFELEIMKEL